MTEATPHALIDFDNLPLTVDQQILAALKRIEVLLTPKPVVAEAATKLPFSKARGK